MYRYISYYYVSIMCGLKLYITDCVYIVYNYTIEQLYIKSVEILQYHYWSVWSLFLYNCCTLENMIIYYREHQMFSCWLYRLLLYTKQYHIRPKACIMLISTDISYRAILYNIIVIIPILYIYIIQICPSYNRTLL